MGTPSPAAPRAPSARKGGDPPVAPDTETVVFPAADQDTTQASLFARAILDDTEVSVPIEDAIANMRVIETILATRPSG